MVFLLISCNNEKTQEYIEVSTGLSMNPINPRIGVFINNRDSLYVCEEIIYNNTRSGEYNYYKSTNKINFRKFKMSVSNVFNDSLFFKSIPDEQSNQIIYNLDNRKYKQNFYTHQLSKSQQIVFKNILQLKKSQNLEKISYHVFSKDLLQQKLPLPPSQ